MSQLLALRKRFQLNCYQITAVICIVTLYFEHAEHCHFEILHIIWGIILQSVKAKKNFGHLIKQGTL